MVRSWRAETVRTQIRLTSDDPADGVTRYLTTPRGDERLPQVGEHGIDLDVGESRGRTNALAIGDMDGKEGNEDAQLCGAGRAVGHGVCVCVLRGVRGGGV